MAPNLDLRRRTIAGLAAFAFLGAGPSRAEGEVRFAPLEDVSLKDPDNPIKTFRVDFARLEHDLPLTRAELAGITPGYLKSLTQEQVDQIYGRLTAGPIPDGIYRGGFFAPRGDDMSARLEEVLGGIRGRLAGGALALFELVGHSVWKGKVFDRERRLSRSLVQNFLPLRPLVDDPDTVETLTIPREGIRRRFWPKDTVWLLFPAKVYCGQSLLDGRRESVVIDYAYGDELPGYRESPDSLAGRGGLKLREEVRMVRPGLYLGRAYANRMFLLNFVLENSEQEADGRQGFSAGASVREDCWPGEQARRITIK